MTNASSGSSGTNIITRTRGGISFSTIFSDHWITIVHCAAPEKVKHNLAAGQNSRSRWHGRSLMPRGCIQLYCSFRSVSSPFITQRSSDTILTVADKDWSPRALRGYSAPSNVRRDRIAIILEHGTAVREVFMIYPAVLRGSLDRLDYTTADMTYTSSQWICAILQWPSSVTVTKISVRGYRDQKQSMEKLEDLLEYINENH
jgi:hypothetical protein